MTPSELKNAYLCLMCRFLCVRSSGWRPVLRTSFSAWRILVLGLGAVHLVPPCVASNVPEGILVRVVFGVLHLVCCESWRVIRVSSFAPKTS